MRAKFIYENIGFEREDNPQKSLRIGKYKPQIFKVKDYQGDEQTIEVIDNNFMLNDMEVKIEFFEDPEMGERATVYVDGQKSDMAVFKMEPFDYEFKKPEKQESWYKPGESAYGYPIAKDAVDLERLKYKYSTWYVGAGDYNRTDKNPFVAVAKMILFTY